MNKLDLLFEEAGVSGKVLDLCRDIERGLEERFKKADAIAEYNQLKVISAKQKNKLSA